MVTADRPGPRASSGRKAKATDRPGVQDALYRIADMASAASDMDEFYAAMHRIVGELMSADNFYIALYDDENKTLNYPYYVDEVDEELPDPHVWEPMGTGQARGLTAFVLRTGEPQHVPNEHFVRLVADGEVDSIGVVGEDWLGVPLLSEGKSIGVVVVQTYDRGQRYSEQDKELLTFVGQHIASALTRARAIAETKRLLAESNQRAAELAIINGVQAGLAQRIESQQMYDLVGDKIQEIFDAQVVDIGIVDPDAGLIRFPYTIERGQRFPDEPIPVMGIRKHVLEARRPLLINERAAERARELGQDVVLQGEPPKSFLFAPLIVADEGRGVISLQNLDREQAFSEGDVKLLTTLAASLSVALENVRLVDEMRQRVAELGTINSIGQALSAQLELDALIELVGDKMQETFNADIVYVAMLNAASGMIEFPYHVEGEDRTAPPPLQPGQGLTSRILQTREPLLLNSDVQRPSLGPVVGTPARSFLGVPILVRDEAIGAVAIQSTREEGRFDEADAKLLATIAAGIGVAIQNAKLYQETRRLYSEAQEARAEAERHRRELAHFLPSTVADLMASSDGSPLLAAHRREITAIYCDLRGFTDFTQTAEPEEVFELLEAYQRQIGQLVLESGGTLAHYAGDGIMAFFNDPKPVADHPLVVVSIALEMQRRFGALARDWARRGFELGLGIGISTGYATVGRVGFEGYYAYAAIGSVANLAARLCAVAKPGQIVVSGRTFAMVDTAVQAEPLGSFELKGFGRPVEAFAATGLKDTAAIPT
jgi:class 3 adenylate cyclase/putative methionine-R-sulfoxide reductase with GAF domain